MRQNSSMSRLWYILCLTWSAGTVILSSCSSEPKERSNLRWATNVQEYFDVPTDTLLWMEDCINSAEQRTTCMFRSCINPAYFEGEQGLYELVDTMATTLHSYDGNMRREFDWLWHNAMKAEIDKYLERRYTGTDTSDSARYCWLLREICLRLNNIDIDYTTKCWAGLVSAYQSVSRWYYAGLYQEQLNTTTDSIQKQQIKNEWHETIVYAINEPIDCCADFTSDDD